MSQLDAVANVLILQQTTKALTLINYTVGATIRE